MVGLQMPVRRSAVTVSGAELDVDQIQHAMTNSALGNHFLGKLAHALYGTFQHDRLDALIMIQVRMHRGHGEIVIGMLNTG
jgi:hypothetical protein